MTGGVPEAWDLLRVVLALLAGYAAGSMPVSAWVGRAAGVDWAREQARDADLRAGSAAVWRLAGPGWGVLALAGDLARGVLPVALLAVTFTWWTGWTGAVAAVAGAGWPALGRMRGGRAVATFAGACAALAPLAGAGGMALAVSVALVGRAAGRNARVAGITAGICAYPVLFLLEHRDLGRLAAVGILYLVAAARYAVTR